MDPATADACISAPWLSAVPKDLPNMTRLSQAALLAAVALVAACDPGTSSKATPGDLTVTLDTPTANDRAMVVTLSGPAAPTAVQGAAAGYVVHSRAQGTTTRVAIFGVIGDGALLRVTVPDVRQAKQYTAMVTEAADANNNTHASLAGYALSVDRAGS
jgi:hypothetical protein